MADPQLVGTPRSLRVPALSMRVSQEISHRPPIDEKAALKRARLDLWYYGGGYYR